MVIHILNSSMVGGWSTQGVKFIKELSNDTTIICHSTHLTSFAVLVSPQDERPVSIPVIIISMYVRILYHSYAYIHIYIHTLIIIICVI